MFSVQPPTQLSALLEDSLQHIQRVCARIQEQRRLRQQEQEQREREEQERRRQQQQQQKSGAAESEDSDADALDGDKGESDTICENNGKWGCGNFLLSYLWCFFFFFAGNNVQISRELTFHCIESHFPFFWQEFHANAARRIPVRRRISPFPAKLHWRNPLNLRPVTPEWSPSL